MYEYVTLQVMVQFEFVLKWL